MVEVWKDVVGYEGKYQVSNMGRVKSLNYRHTGKEEILKNTVNIYGYRCVNLYKYGKRKTYQVHRLVAMAFVDGYEEGLVVNHIDEDKTNNCAWNLEWCTYEYNNSYGTRNERASEKMKGSKNHKARKVQCIETGEIFITVNEACKFIGVSSSAIAHAIKRNGSCKGLHWKYVS